MSFSTDQYKVYMKTLTANIRLSFKQILHREIWADNIKLIIVLGEKKNEKVEPSMSLGKMAW